MARSKAFSACFLYDLSFTISFSNCLGLNLVATDSLSVLSEWLFHGLGSKRNHLQSSKFTTKYLAMGRWESTWPEGSGAVRMADQ